LARCIAFTFAHRDHARVAVGIDIHAVHTRLLNRERHIRRVDLVDLAAKQVANMHVERALVQFHLHRAVADVGQGQAGLVAHAHDARAHVQFGARFLIRPHVIGNRQRTVQTSRNPILGAARLNRNRSRHVLQTRCSSRRIILIRSRRLARLLILYGSLILHLALIRVGFLVLRQCRNRRQRQHQSHRQHYAL
jgi:hypothetical protein